MQLKNWDKLYYKCKYNEIYITLPVIKNIVFEKNMCIQIGNVVS